MTEDAKNELSQIKFEAKVLMSSKPSIRTRDMRYGDFKRRLERLGLSPEEYQDACRDLARILKI